MSDSVSPSAEIHDQDPGEIKNGRHAFLFFFIYLALYLGFVGLSAFDPDALAWNTPIGGLNLAIVYGMVLIFAAIVLASLYAFLNRPASESK
ncbi:Protein of unknown function, DUF485 [Verrucomicrobium sp. GAS474]|uniref:DUF485 domain-containing protein n=1 Tax=Verrucomicrobium sp. GAS474 TaxID=1882831 RepID=UPI00087D916F|nr:DUF485 domain-containing protein [Verrucomicrobium sp. GAS474]SDU04205.1 Protein of unknown function, DUF485 [Verrucomicrobium sp. GAS474]